MNLSAPAYRLMHRAKVIARNEHIPLHQALDRVAVNEGFARWSGDLDLGSFQIDDLVTVEL